MTQHRLETDDDFEVTDTGRDDEPEDQRTLEEVLESIDRHRWTPPSGSPSVLDLLREDRDR